jgi:hypothetical protein
LTIGQSTTRLFYRPFAASTSARPDRNPRLRLVGAAQDGVVLGQWAFREEPWTEAREWVAASGLTPAQVQVLWIEVAEIRTWRFGDLPSRMSRISDEIGQVMRRASRVFPNLEIAFLTSRPYGGYSNPRLDPEPYAYDSGFAVRTAIHRQIMGEPGFSTLRGRGSPGRLPVMLWGPYYWADGPKPSTNGLSWLPQDFFDGLHPSWYGAEKGARVMSDFFANDPFARHWFLAPEFSALPS